jgi:16S rRNA (adenine1518-N6/adenine1519-N6)-dimethyltransferase
MPADGSERGRSGALAVLRAHGLRPKRALSQIFLEDRGVAARIAALATTPVGGTVLEIGAGLGALTGPLSERASRVVAIERDGALVPILRERLRERRGVTVVEGDATELAWVPLLAGPRPRVVAGNLPYGVTGLMLERVTSLAAEIDRAVLMVQREVAERVAAAPGSRAAGMLSIFVQAAFRVERALRVPAGAFAPRPKVDSAVMVLTPLAPPRARETPLFREVVRRAFAQRRKRLRNAWQGLAGLERPLLEQAADAAGIDLSLRAEALAVEDFARMAEKLRKP